MPPTGSMSLNSKLSLPRSTIVVLASSSAVILVTYRLVQWRARKRARKTVDRVKAMVPENQPLIDWKNERTVDRLLHAAIRRASKWMRLSEEVVRPMLGQVGGLAKHKRPILTLEPDYILKPLITDHRGLREIAFYEAMRSLSKTPTNSNYTTFLLGKDRTSFLSNRWGELLDTIALALAISWHDPIVTQSEAELANAWKMVKREVDALSKLAKFTSPYYGVVGSRGGTLSKTSPALGLTEDFHLLLQDLTINYSHPCSMDLKLGTQTYEPDALETKRVKEYNKYPEQAQFGCRVVGMRMYDPTHADADERGYRSVDKAYGRSLKTKEALLDSLKQFFSSGIVGEERIRRKVLHNLLAQLKPLRRWFEENTSLRFYASSLLIVYEGNNSSDNEAGNNDTASVKMIDFGHVRRELGGDAGYSHGLRTLKNLLVELLDDEEERLEALAAGESSSAAVTTNNNNSNNNSSSNKNNNNANS